MSKKESSNEKINIVIANSAFDLLTNVAGVKLIESYSGKLLEGKIQLATNRGYPNDLNKPQQDAVLSIVKDENHFLNAIADGAGGSNKGENASRELICGIEKWFEQISIDKLDDIDLTIKLLTKKINEIGDTIYKKYENCYTTLVLSLTINNKTVIINVGDSTAYSFDGNELIELTTLDSWANGYYYEDVRWSPENNILTAAIGDGFRVIPHVKIIDNNGQRIILSSDGVTDLISEETFISYFKNSSTAEKIVDDALNNPEVTYEFVEDDVTEIHYLKQSDNISAIVIELPKAFKTVLKR